MGILSKRSAGSRVRETTCIEDRRRHWRWARPSAVSLVSCRQQRQRRSSVHSSSFLSLSPNSPFFFSFLLLLLLSSSRLFLAYCQTRCTLQPVTRGGKDASRGGRELVAERPLQERNQGNSRTCWTRGKTGHSAAWCQKGGNTNLYAVDEDESETMKKHLTMMKSCKRGVC